MNNTPPHIKGVSVNTTPHSQITQITGDSEEVRISTNRKTFVFTRQGFHIATGGCSSMDELKEVATLLYKHKTSLTDVHKAIINLTFADHNVKTI